MLPNYQTILYATDLSENARAAFGHAVSLARAYQAKVHLLHVVPELRFDTREQVMSTFGYTSKVLGETLDEKKIELARKELTEKIRKRLQAFATEELGAGAESLDWLGGIEVKVGSSAVAEILQASDRLDADLMVFGSHSKGMVQYAFLGSVAEKVLRRSPRPVLIVPLPA